LLSNEGLCKLISAALTLINETIDEPTIDFAKSKTHTIRCIIAEKRLMTKSM
jgi:hypothetical protein